MTARIVSLLAGAAALTAPAFAAPVTLGRAVESALEHDPSITAARAGVEKREAGVDAAEAAGRPSAGLRAEVGALETRYPNLFNPSAGNVTASQLPHSAGLEAEWDVYTSGANAAGVDVAEYQRRSANQQLDGTREQIVLATLEAYSDAWLKRRIVEVGEARVETLALRLEETRSRFDQGLGTRTDIALNEARLAAAQARLEASRAGLAVASARLERLTGLTGAEPVAPVADGLDTPDSLQAALETVRQGNARLKAARAGLEAAEAGTRQARGRFGPKITLSARATAGKDVSFFFEDGEISDYGAFVTLNVPLYTSGLKSAKTREARAARSQALADLRRVELSLREQVAGLWGDLEARTLSLDAARRAEEAAELASEGARREYEAGMRTLVDSLDAENEYRDAQIRTLQARTALFVTRARLLALSSDLEDALAPSP